MANFPIDWEKEERSKIQTAVKKFLHPYWKMDIVYSELPVFGTRLKIDLVNMTRLICVETDGNQHDSFNPFFHNNSRIQYLNSIKRDVKKEQFLEINNIKLIRIPEKEVKNLTKKWFEEQGIIL